MSQLRAERDPSAGDLGLAFAALDRFGARQDHGGAPRDRRVDRQASRHPRRRKEIYRIIVEELKEIKEKYGDERRTQIVDRSDEISIEDTMVDEDMAVTISHDGYIKAQSGHLFTARSGAAARARSARRRKRKTLSSTCLSRRCIPTSSFSPP